MKLYYQAFEVDRQVQQLSYEGKREQKNMKQSLKIPQFEQDLTQNYCPILECVDHQGSTPPPYDSQGLKLPNHT